MLHMYTVNLVEASHLILDKKLKWLLEWEVIAIFAGFLIEDTSTVLKKSGLFLTMILQTSMF